MAKIVRKKPTGPAPTSEPPKTVPVAVIEETARASDVVLADGTMLAVRPVVRGVRRAVDKTDADGRPIYFVDCSLNVGITVAGSTGK